MTDVLYAALAGPNTTSDLYTVDSTDASMVSLGPIGYAVSGMAVDPTDGTLYGATSEKDGTSFRTLITIDTTTGAGTIVGSFSNGGSGAHDIAFDATGQLWAVSNNGGRLWQIDKTTGIAVDVGIVSGHYAGGCDFDSGGTLYHIGSQAHNVGTRNLATGAFTNVVTLSDSQPYHSGSFDGSDTFWASGPSETGNAGANLVTIDTATGVVTIVGAFSTPGVGALAWAAAGAPVLRASFTATPVVGYPPHTATFTDHSTPGPSGPITGWAWDFGDGNTSTLQNPTNIYALAGAYTVSLTVTGTSPDGTATQTRTNYIHVIALDAVLYAALAGVDHTTSDLYTVAPFDASMISVGPINDAISGMAVDPTTGILYGSVSRRSTGTAGAGALITIDTATGAGTLVGGSGSLYAHEIAFDSTGQLWGIDTGGDLMQIDKTNGTYVQIGSASDYGGGLDFDSGDQLWHVGDRNGDIVLIDTSTGTPTVVGATAWRHSGKFDLDEGGFWASSPGGGHHAASQLVIIDVATGAVTTIGSFSTAGVGALAWGAPPALTANFTAAPTSGLASLSVHFTDTSIPGPSGPITGWLWDFGDSGFSTAQNPTHNYTNPGNYTVTLTITGTSPDGTAFKVRSNYIHVFDPADLKLYAALAGGDHTTSHLYLVDSSDASMTDIGPIGYALTGMAYDPTTATLYGATSAKSTSHPGALITIDPATGAGTLVAVFSGFFSGAVHDIAFDASGQLWGAHASGGAIMKINKATAVTTNIGGGGGYAGGLDFDTGGVLWKVGYNGDNVATLSRTTGSPTHVSSTSDRVHSGKFDPDDLFWASFPGASGHAAPDLVTIDVNTGTVTTIGTFTHAGVGALVWVNTSPPPADFTFTLVPDTITVSPGVTTLIHLHTHAISGDTETITLSASTVFGYTVTFDNNPITAGDDTVANIVVSGSLSPPSTATMHFHATGTDNTHSADLTIHLVALVPGTHIAS